MFRPTFGTESLIQSCGTFDLRIIRGRAVTETWISVKVRCFVLLDLRWRKLCTAVSYSARKTANCNFKAYWSRVYSQFISLFQQVNVISITDVASGCMYVGGGCTSWLPLHLPLGGNFKTPNSHTGESKLSVAYKFRTRANEILKLSGRVSCETVLHVTKPACARGGPNHRLPLPAVIAENSLYCF